MLSSTHLEAITINI